MFKTHLKNNILTRNEVKQEPMSSWVKIFDKRLIHKITDIKQILDNPRGDEMISKFDLQLNVQEVDLIQLKKQFEI